MLRLQGLPDALILLAAPEGAGKTQTLLALANSLARDGAPCHWLTLADLPEAPHHGHLLIDAAGFPAATEAAQALLDWVRLRLRRQKLVLAFEDGLPDLLHQEWIAGRAAVLRAEDLAFTPDEAAALFGQDGTSREMQLLHQFTNGWPMALALLSREPERALALMRRNGGRLPLPKGLGQWFEDRIAGRLDPKLLNLLMDLAVFAQFPMSLLPALPPHEAGLAAPAQLGPLLHAGVFLRSCDRRPGWIGFMPAFARFLRERLDSVDPARAEQLRRFAVDWGARNNDTSAVMRVGLSVWTPQEALACVDAIGALHVSLGAGPDIDLSTPIDAASARQTPLAFFGLIYERIRNGALPEARLHYENAAALTESFTRFDTPQDMAVIAGWTSIFEVVMRIADDRGFPHDCYERIVASFRAAFSGEPVLAMAHATLASLVPLDMGLLDEALGASQLGLQLQERLRADRAAIFVALHRASALIASARLDEAMECIRAGHQLTRSDTYADSYELISCQIHAGLCVFEMGDLEQARTLLEPCYPVLPRIHGWRRFWAEFFTALAEIGFQSKGLAGAEVWLRRGIDFAALRAQPQLAILMDLLRRDFLLRAGGKPADLALLPELPPHAAPAIGYFAGVLAVEQELAAGEAAGARARLAALDRQGLIRCDLRLELRALTLDLVLDAEPSAAVLHQAFDLARALPRLGGQPWMHSRLRRGYEQLVAQGAALDEALHQAFAAPKARVPTLLSPRESQIIGLIAEGLSTKEIARALEISEGTVKSHRKNLYEKLQAGTRSKAIARARELQVLPLA